MHTSIVKLLLSHKVEVSSRTTGGVTPLYGASKEGHHAIVVALLQAGADPLLPLISGDLPIHAAAQRNHLEVVRILIEIGAYSPDQVKNACYRREFAIN